MERKFVTGLTLNWLIAISYIYHCLCMQCKDGTYFSMTYTSNTKIVNSWFYNCTGAHFFNLSNNQITRAGNESFVILWNVHVLDLSYNDISLIENDALVTMRSLKYLYLHHNKLVELPLDFFKNKNILISVDLSYNNITHIPLTVFNHSMERIDTVILHHNHIKAFEPWAYFRQPIRMIDLQHNLVTTFTNEHNWTFTSTTVRNKPTTDLRYNNITSWHDWYLQQYIAERSEIDAALAEILPDIRENPLTCDCFTYNMVNRVTNSFFIWSVSDYLDITCFNPPKLRGKRAFYDVDPADLVCSITEDCPTGCVCNDIPDESVLSVDCRDLGMTYLPTMLPSSPYHAIKIQVGNNNIKELKNVSYLEYVTSISMPENFLNEIPDFVMDQLATNSDPLVDFRNNSLTSIPKGTQNIKFENTQFQGNDLECSCEMLWMVVWIKMAPRYTDKSLNCTFKGKEYRIIDLTEDTMDCNESESVILIVVLSLVLVVVIAVLITAKRCPYETKVLIFKIFRIHPANKYEVDSNTDKSYDMYVSFDDDDPYVRQWVIRVLIKQLEEKMPRYRICIYARNGPPGPEAESRLQLIDKSKRLLIILSEKYENHTWCEYELCHSETLEQNEGRIIYLLYDKNAEEISTREPWLSKMKDRKVFSLQEKMLWSKMRYELPVERLPAIQIKKGGHKNTSM